METKMVKTGSVRYEEAMKHGHAEGNSAKYVSVTPHHRRMGGAWIYVNTYDIQKDNKLIDIIQKKKKGECVDVWLVQKINKNQENFYIRRDTPAGIEDIEIEENIVGCFEGDYIEDGMYEGIGTIERL